MALAGGNKLGRGHTTVLFKLAAEVGWLLETDLKRDVLDGIHLAQKGLGMEHALFIQPLLGSAA